MFIWGQVRVYIGLFDKNTKENVLRGINNCFISFSINWLGELGVDAIEAWGNNEVIVLDPLAATFWPSLFLFEYNLFVASLLGLVCNLCG